MQELVLIPPVMLAFMAYYCLANTLLASLPGAGCALEDLAVGRDEVV